MELKKSIMFIAGDPSGDFHAAPIIKQLRTSLQNVDIWGIGGPQMISEGFISLMPFEPFNKMGYIEVLSHLSFFLKAKKDLIKHMQLRKPDCLVCVDYPGFNMPMMKAAKQMGIPVVWYIAPMVWAWKKKRAKVLAEHASHIACIFPFETEHFLPFTNNVHFVGNPVAEAIDREITSYSDNKTEKITKIAVVPGSRKQEVERMLLPMLETVKLLKKEFPDLKATVSHFSSLPESLFEIVKKYVDVEISKIPLRKLLNSTDLALITSGTATLEAALLGKPGLIVYRTSGITYKIYKSLVKIKHIGLPNIIAKNEIMPECIQDEVEPETMAKKMKPFLNDKEFYNATVSNLCKLKNKLGAQKPSVEVSSLVISTLNL